MCTVLLPPGVNPIAFKKICHNTPHDRGHNKRDVLYSFIEICLCLNQYLEKRILSRLVMFVQDKCSYLDSTRKCFLLFFLSGFGLAYYEASLNCLFIVYFTTSPVFKLYSVDGR
jgi:hypothetical protein